MVSCHNLLLSHCSAQRQIAMFAHYFPLLYHEYVDAMAELQQKQPYLRRYHSETVYPAASANFGRVVCYEHADFSNKANGICPIWCGGSFDHRLGGHLILWQLKMVIQFPAGSLICIPSATLRHGNISIAKHETRVSFTQYAAGGLFKWVHYGHQTWEQLAEKDEDFAAAELAIRNTRWRQAAKKFSTIESLHRDRIAAGLVSK